MTVEKYPAPPVGAKIERWYLHHLLVHYEHYFKRYIDKYLSLTYLGDKNIKCVSTEDNIPIQWQADEYNIINWKFEDHPLDPMFVRDELLPRLHRLKTVSLTMNETLKAQEDCP